MSSRLLPDLSYAYPAPEGHKPERRVDVYLPEGDGPFPVALWIHGGGWHSGSKDLDFADEYTRRGIAVVSIGYRLTPTGEPFPGPIDDCVLALAWLGREGANYSLDNSRIGVFGHSAGGHLAALLALTSVGATPFGIPGLPPISCAAIWDGVLNLGREDAPWPSNFFPWNPADPFCRTFFPGGEYEETFALWASPSTYVSEKMPPTFVVHGDSDRVVPWQQARDFAERLKALGVDARFDLLPGVNHNAISPELHEQTCAFFWRVWDTQES